MPFKTACPAGDSEFTSSTRNTGSNFLKLPPEIRNHIYRFALLEPNDIVISDFHQPTEPAIMLVNRQIRRETLKIYYQENAFEIAVVDFDSRILQKWFSSCPYVHGCAFHYSVTKRPHWQNLYEWLKAFYYGKTNGHYPNSNAVSEPCIMASIFTIVARMKFAQRLSWAEIDAYLKDMHQVLIAADPAWA